jgi:predicted PurR-regulated permease PerM
VGVAILSTIAVVGALYLARAFFVPLLIGILGSYALSPLVDWLRAHRIPRAVGAALVLGVLVAAGTWTTVALRDDASALIAKLPEAARKVRQLGEVRDGSTTSLQKIQEAATELQGAADAAADKKPTKPAAPRPAEQNAWVRDYMLAQSALLFAVIAQAPIVILLTYFLLASGEHFRRKLVQLVGPSLSARRTPCASSRRSTSRSSGSSSPSSAPTSWSGSARGSRSMRSAWSRRGHGAWPPACCTRSRTSGRCCSRSRAPSPLSCSSGRP